ncbi:MAG TPA: RDD family protein [Euzebyales bacterium]|nr:RDD family protein [Euzebyales bacterium]
MSNDPSADRPGDHASRWDDRPPPGTPPPGHPEANPDASYGWGTDPVPAAGTRPADVGKRVGAYIIDMLLLTVVFVFVGVIVGLGSGPVPATPEAVSAGQSYLYSVITAGLMLAYFVMLEASSGQTLAKRMLGIKVTMADGGPVTLEAAFKRRVLFVIGSVIPLIGGLISFAVPLAALITTIQDDPDNRGFHDRWAATRVVDA